MDTKQTPNTPQWLLDRMAERATEVLNRNQAKSPLIAGFSITLPERAGNYRKQYAELDLYRREVRWLSDQAMAEIETLSTTASSWVQRLARHLTDFDTRPLATTEVPHDVIAHSERLLERTRYLVDEKERPIPYAEQLTAHLQPLIESAKAAFLVRQDALVTLQERRAELRETAVLLEDELIALRNVLRKELGSNHRDYQYLRITRIRREDFDNTENDIATGPPTDDEVEAPDAMPVVENVVDGEPANDTDEEADNAA